jgi:hypothetical protein
LNDSLLLSTLLSTSIINLRRKGFPVDRILNLQQGKLKAATVKAAESPNQSSESLSQNTQQQPLPPAPPQKTPAVPANYSPTSEFAQLAALFPDIDHDFLRQQLEAEKGNRHAVETVSNRLLDMDYPKMKSLPPAPSMNEKNTAKNDDKQIAAPGGWPASADSKSNDSVDDLMGTINRFADTVRRGWLGDMLGVAAPASNKLDANNSINNNNRNDSNANSPSTSNQRLPALPPVPPSSSSSNPVPGGSGGPPIEEITPQYTNALKQQLSKSIASVQVARDKEFRAQIPAEPEVVEIPKRHVSASCTPLSDNDLVLAEVVNDVQVYVDRNTMDDAKTVLRTSRVGLVRFIRVLSLLAKVFNMDPRAMNVYWDKVGGTVAFNRGRTLFFNLRFYLGLHFKNNRPEDNIPEELDTYYYWFLVACHELAHNFVAEHNSHHEYYLTSFAEVSFRWYIVYP